MDERPFFFLFSFFCCCCCFTLLLFSPFLLNEWTERRNILPQYGLKRSNEKKKKKLSAEYFRKIVVVTLVTKREYRFFHKHTSCVTHEGRKFQQEQPVFFFFCEMELLCSPMRMLEKHKVEKCSKGCGE